MATQDIIINKSNALNLIGKKFGYLTVINREKNSVHKKTMWNCLCLCGNYSIVNGSNLNNNRTKSCGCLQHGTISNNAKKRLDDLTNKIFGRLVVIERSHNASDGKPMWLCKCQCGKIKSVKAANLRSGSTISCGCYKKETSAKKLYKHGMSYTKEYKREKNAKANIRKRNNPVYLAKLRISDLIRKSIKLRSFRKEQSCSVILGCTYSEFRVHIERQFIKGMNWSRFNEIHIDHIIPLATAKTIEDIYRLNHYTNLRPMWAKDNILKGAKIEFLI